MVKRKMKSSVLCLLFATAALAVEYNHLQHPSNLVYSFSQQRVDQPPHVEMRDEDLGKYRNRPRTTTTEMPASAFNTHPVHVMDNMQVQQHLNMATTPRSYIDEHKNQIYNRHLPVTMPPPPATPKWMDLSDNLQAHQHDYSPSASQAHAHYSAPWNGEHPSYQMHNNHLSHPVNTAFPDPHYYAPSTQAPENHFMQQPIQEQHKTRGSHKFNWNDAIEPRHQSINNIPSSTRAPMPPHNKNPSRPIPTLSPWSGDNFGK